MYYDRDFIVCHINYRFSSAEILMPTSFALAGFSFSRKHGVVTFVHERMKYALFKKSPPKYALSKQSETEWLCGRWSVQK